MSTIDPEISMVLCKGMLMEESLGRLVTLLRP